MCGATILPPRAIAMSLSLARRGRRGLFLSLANRDAGGSGFRGPKQPEPEGRYTGSLGPPGRCSRCWPHDGEIAGGADSTLVISGSGRWRWCRRGATYGVFDAPQVPDAPNDWADFVVISITKIVRRLLAPIRQARTRHAESLQDQENIEPQDHCSPDYRCDIGQPAIGESKKMLRTETRGHLLIKTGKTLVFMLV